MILVSYEIDAYKLWYLHIGKTPIKTENNKNMRMTVMSFDSSASRWKAKMKFLYLNLKF